MSDPALLHSTSHWRIFTEPLIPGARLHFRLEPVQPADDVIDLPRAALNDFWTALAWLKDGYDLTYYVSVIRSGDHRYTGGNDPYVRVYVVVGDREPNTIAKYQISSRGDL